MTAPAAEPEPAATAPAEGAAAVERAPLEILVTCPVCRRDNTHDWAREAVKIPFLPLSRKQPAWEPTGEEAGQAAPAFQALAGELAGKYLPEGIVGFAGRNSTLLVFLVAMGGLFWLKWRQVQRLQAERTAAAAPVRSPGPAASGPGLGAEYECEYCHSWFTDRVALGRHYESCAARAKS